MAILYLQGNSLALAVFDLDNTLLEGDSDYLWGEFAVAEGIVDSGLYERENRRFYEQYQAGTLDIHAFLAFQLRPLAQHDINNLHAWRRQFMQDKIAPIILPKARSLLQQHRDQGHTLMIITSTNRFITEPIAAELGVEHLLASEPEMSNGRYTGTVAGVPCYQEGKIENLGKWLAGRDCSLEGSWFYSDSHNDRPLLDRVDHPVAVDPDSILTEYAKAKGWPVISLR